MQRPSGERLRLLVVRHGETDCNVQGIIQGQLDTDLNAVGRQQAQLVGKALSQEHIDEVYSSPLRRARDTADAIVAANPRFRQHNEQFENASAPKSSATSAASGSNRPHSSLNGYKQPGSRSSVSNELHASYWFDDRLKERGFGVLEGKRLDRSQPRRDSTQGIEQMSDFSARLATFLADVLLQPAPWIATGSGDAADSSEMDKELHTKYTRRAEVPIASITDDHSNLTPMTQLNTSDCVRTIVIVAHGAAISALIGAVLLDSGLAVLGVGVSRTRIWNCSITEIFFNVGQIRDLPLLETKEGQKRVDLVSLVDQSNESKRFVIERWADVRHLPSSLDDAVADKGSADEMVGRQAS